VLNLSGSSHMASGRLELEDRQVRHILFPLASIPAARRSVSATGRRSPGACRAGRGSRRSRALQPPRGPILAQTTSRFGRIYLRLVLLRRDAHFGSDLSVYGLFLGILPSIRRNPYVTEGPQSRSLFTLLCLFGRVLIRTKSQDRRSSGSPGKTDSSTGSGRSAPESSSQQRR
jgi:hypothetical protein